MARTHDDAMRRLWDAWSRGSVADLTAQLHPDVEWSSVALGRTYRGHGEVAPWLEGLRGRWKSLTVSFDATEELGGGVVLARGQASGFDHSGDRTLDGTVTWVVEFAGDLVVRGQVFRDEAAARAWADELRGG
jgi:ketosteroid isomerase-like protein